MKKLIIVAGFLVAGVGTALAVNSNRASSCCSTACCDTAIENCCEVQASCCKVSQACCTN